MSGELTIHERPSLTDPVLVVMLTGWIDASGAAATAMAHIEARIGARTIGTFDADAFIDYRARRPVLELRDGVVTNLVWPVTELKAGRDGAGNDVLLLTGYEPDSNWRRFVDVTTGFALEMGVRLMIGLGAYPFATPHTRLARISCTTPSAEMARTVPYLRNSVDVPAGLEAVLERALHERGVPTIGLWAQVPHYIATMAYPAASAALVDAAAATGGLTLDAAELHSDGARLRARLDELVATNPEHVAMVRQLEAAYDALGATPAATGLLADGFDASALPSGEELAAEVERFLREQGR